MIYKLTARRALDERWRWIGAWRRWCELMGLICPSCERKRGKVGGRCDDCIELEDDLAREEGEYDV